MGDFRDVVPQFSVAPQISADTLALAKSAGFAHIINNRPDDEAMGQPSSATLEAAAHALGLSYVHIPVAGGFSMEAVIATEEALAATSSKVLAFCRSGTRSITLWGLASAKTQTHTPAEITKAAHAAGYDLDSYAPTLARLYGAD